MPHNKEARSFKSRAEQAERERKRYFNALVSCYPVKLADGTAPAMDPGNPEAMAALINENRATLTRERDEALAALAGQGGVEFLCEVPTCRSKWLTPSHTRCEACGNLRGQYSKGLHQGYIDGSKDRPSPEVRDAT